MRENRRLCRAEANSQIYSRVVDCQILSKAYCNFDLADKKEPDNLMFLACGQASSRFSRAVRSILGYFRTIGTIFDYVRFILFADVSDAAKRCVWKRTFEFSAPGTPFAEK